MKETERERKARRKKASGVTVPFISFYAGPTGLVDDDGDGSTSRPCSPLALHAGVVSKSGAPFHPGRQHGQQVPLTEVMRGVRQHSIALFDVVGDVSSQVWDIVAMGHVKTCLLPFW